MPPIFFHPDYDRRPWPLTRSADPAHRAGARGLVATARNRACHIPPVGTFTPPWRR